MQTLLLAYPSLLTRLPSDKIIFLPQLQEVKAYTCDTGVDRIDLEKGPEFERFDFSGLTEDWNSKKGFYDPDNVRDRAKWVRRWLRSREEMEIVVMAHGNFIRVLTDNDPRSKAVWENAQVKRSTFSSAIDEDAWLVPMELETGMALAAKEDTDGVANGRE